jgi:HPr kinase/phosphorylase
MSDFLHGTAAVIGEKGILILGASGAGKSGLAERLIHEARGRGLFAGLVGDDRVAVRAAAGRLIVSGHPAIRGQVERRGIGIFNVDCVQKAVLKGVISIVRDPPRLPGLAAQTLDIADISLPLLTLRDDADLAAKAHLALEWIGA